MQAFYALAAEDYRQLAGARDWAADLRGHAADGRVRLLDVACGSGKFPAALLAAGLPAEPLSVTRLDRRAGMVRIQTRPTPCELLAMSPAEWPDRRVGPGEPASVKGWGCGRSPRPGRARCWG